MEEVSRKTQRQQGKQKIGNQKEMLASDTIAAANSEHSLSPGQKAKHLTKGRST
jgi:hypothetical protein